MDLFSPRHLLIVLVIVLLVFGTKKLKTIGSDLGGAFKGFKEAMKDGEQSADEANKSQDAKQDPKQLASSEKPAEQRPAEQRPASTASADKDKAA